MGWGLLLTEALPIRHFKEKVTISISFRAKTAYVDIRRFFKIVSFQTTETEGELCKLRLNI